MSKDFKADIRKLDHMLKDLRDIQSELLPNETSDKMKEDLKNMDAFGKKKVALNAKLKEVRDGIGRLDEAKRSLAVGQRDQDVIKITAENRQNLKECTTLWSELKEIYVKEEKITGKKRLEQKLLIERKKMTNLLGKEIMDLTNRNQSSSVRDGPARPSIGSTSPLDTDADPTKFDRDARRKNKEAQQREERRRKRDKRKRGRKGEEKEDELDDFKAEPMSAQVQAFMEEKDTAVKEQDEILKEINKGLDDLLHMAEDINKTLKVQDAMLDELGEKIDNNIEAFKTANLKLKHLLKESGGLSRWCPVLICFIILLALVGYIYSIIKGGF